MQRDVLGPQLLSSHLWLWGLALAAGGVAWFWVEGAIPSQPRPLVADSTSKVLLKNKLSLALVMIPLALTISGLVLLAGNIRSGLGGYCWGIGLGALLLSAACAESTRTKIKFPVPSARTVIAAMALCTAASVLTLYRLDEIPARLDENEAQDADWALSLIHRTPADGRIAAEAISPFETSGWFHTPMLGIVPFGVVMQVAGETLFGLRILPAAVGALGVGLFFVLLHRYVSITVATAASILMATGQMHLYWMRVAFPVSLFPTIITAIMLTFLQGVESGRYLQFVVSGMLVGLAVALFSAGNVIPVVLCLFFCYLLFVDRRALRLRWMQLIVFSVVALLAFGPSGIWYHSHPEEFFGRTGQVIVFGDPSQYPNLSPIEVLREQMHRAVLGVAVQGDPTPQSYTNPVPVFDPVTGALLLTALVGFTLSVYRPERTLISLWLWSTVFPVFLLTDKPPAFSRAVVALPAAYFAIGVLIDRLLELSRRRNARLGVALASGTLVVSLGMAGFWNLQQFFLVFPRESPQNAKTLAGQFIRTIGVENKAYFVDMFSFWQVEIRFLARGIAGDDVASADIPIQERSHRGAVFVLPPGADATVVRLRASYPDGELREHRNRRGDLQFFSYTVSAAGLGAAAGPASNWREPDARFGRRGPDLGEFESPVALIVGRDLQVYVADASTGQISVFQTDGTPIRRFGEKGGGDAQFNELADLAQSPDGTLLALDHGARWVHRLTTHGHWVGRFGGPNVLVDPRGLAVLDDGTTLVADYGRNAVVAFRTDGTTDTYSPGPDTEQSWLVHPLSVAVAGDGRVYVLDSDGSRVQVFSPEYRLLSTWTLESTGGSSSFRLAIARADDNAVYIPDRAAHVVRRYSSNGDREWAVGPHTGTPIQLESPTAVAADTSGNLYVLDTARVQVFRFDLSRRLF